MVLSVHKYTNEIGVKYEQELYSSASAKKKKKKKYS